MYIPTSKTMLLVLLVTILASFPALGQTQVDTIIQRSVEANESDWKADPDYNYFERDRERGQDKTYHVYMIAGSPYHQLVAVNGKPLSEEEQKKEEQKLQQVIADRQHEPPEQRSQRIASFEKDRKRDHAMMEELTRAFNFTLIGEQKLGPYDVYVLNAKPRPGYQPPNNHAKVLTGMEGRLWIDKNSFQWVKVQAEVIHPVSIAGFLARVMPGTSFELEKMPVSDNVWLIKHFAMKANAKIAFVFKHSEQEDETYWGYSKAGQAEAGTQQSLNTEIHGNGTSR